MSLFDKLVTEALQGQRTLASLRPVVEKELLHHDILREMSTAGLLKNLTFIGGTCLRACHGSRRLSEDLDFTGGNNFEVNDLSLLAQTLTEGLNQKYGLQVEVSEPKKTTSNVDTWKLLMTTRPQQKNLPAQRIHIDICAIPSYDRQPMVLRNFYGVEMGTSGLIIQAQSRQEILADKMVAFALRPNRIKNRDLWDISWLKQQNVSLSFDLVKNKIKDHNRNPEEFLDLLAMRNNELGKNPKIHQSFIHEMRRFLPPDVVSETITNEDFWTYLKTTVRAESDLIMVSMT
ncbi:MAG: nucleotidyl transferase AbiEii/AbiGii toxin family protein [bacterium]|nr:nucleotidyl transferase AbiEii/AbiGii toxin family protein [bacterium]